ncbi:DUF3870 domain-containing protein [Sulfobacillus harzensis]|uniref:DUF3870 domain-containing protein n=1 Tax=Sulfobacillus harzensis TaxID=2729629 RepID=A0A7Y0L7G0_9FIRM|nr:DUF3870 domain-containing protein [Sulfobacillus harzensis]NMP23319.1 DUF3870 domain-containing protein [Sulfobacillus harzensis]
MAKTVFIVGHAKPPKGMSAADVFSTLSLALVVEVRHGVILEASCSLITEAGRNFISRLLVGESLLDDPDAVERAIAAGYLGAAQAAIQAAWKDVVYQFRQYKTRHIEPVSSERS